MFVIEQLKKKKNCIILWSILNNVKPFSSLEYAKTLLMSRRNLSIQDEINYIYMVFNDYLTYSGLSAENFKGKKIIEIGGGSNLGVAILFIIAGAKEVIVLDKYIKTQNSKEYFIYKELRSRLEDSSKEVFDRVVKFNVNERIDIDQSRIKFMGGVGIEAADKFFKKGSIDFILSRAVLEEINNIDLAFSIMDYLLAPEGMMIHKIDLRDYGMFSSKGLHPLTFLTIPSPIYRLMKSNTPNRNRKGYYDKKMQELGYHSRSFTTHMINEMEFFSSKEKNQDKRDNNEEKVILQLKKMRPKLAMPYRMLSDEELMIDGIFLIARKVIKKGERSIYKKPCCMRIIINADDFGESSKTNSIIFNLISARKITSATLLANAPYLLEAIKMSKSFKNCSFGIHLNMTSGYPLSSSPFLKAILDDQGLFLPSKERKMIFTPFLYHAIYLEWCAQIEKLLALGVKISHIDSHNHVHTLPQFFPLLKWLQRKYRLRKVRISKNFYSLPSKASFLLSCEKNIYNFFLQHCYATKTCSGFTDLISFYEGRNDKHILRDTFEIMVHPQDRKEELDLLNFSWEQELPFYIKKISYYEL